LSLEKLKLTAEQIKALEANQLLALPLVRTAIKEAEQQGQDYMRSLIERYPLAKLHGFSVVALGFERIVFRPIVFLT
jgi:hypothetical protein